MKEKFRRCWALVLVFVIVTGVCFLFAGRKSGMFIDEIYAYGLSNSHYAPFLTDIKDGEMVGKTFTRQELFDYVAVTDTSSGMRSRQKFRLASKRKGAH